MRMSNKNDEMTTGESHRKGKIAGTTPEDDRDKKQSKDTRDEKTSKAPGRVSQSGEDLDASSTTRERSGGMGSEGGDAARTTDSRSSDTGGMASQGGEQNTSAGRH